MGTKSPLKLLSPCVVSGLCVLLSCGTLYLSGLAIGYEIGFWAIMAAFPVIVVASLLPLGIGGMGGYQLVTLAVFNIFGLQKASITSASLLQNAISLLVFTLFGVLFAHLSYAQIRSLIIQKSVPGEINVSG